MSSVNLEKITRLKLSDQLLGKLHQMIRDGELAVGDSVPSERSLMERFGVGRPAVREALQSLHNQGVITISHGERSRVNELSVSTVLDHSDNIARLLIDTAPANLDHLKQVRRMFECGIIRVATSQSTSEDIAMLRRLVEEQRSYLGDASEFINADMRFHTRIAEISANPIITAVSAAMLRWLNEYHSALLHWSGNEDVTLAEHSQIISCMESGDGDAAVLAMQKHLDRSSDLYSLPTKT